MVRTLDADRYISGTVSGRSGRTARKNTAQRATVQRTTAQRSSARTTTVRTATAQKTSARTATAQKTSARTTTAQRSSARTTTARTATAQKTSARTTAVQRTAAPKTTDGRITAERTTARRTDSRRSGGEAVRSDGRNMNMQKRRTDRAIKTEIEPAGRGVRVDVADYNSSDDEMRAPRSAMSFQRVIFMLALIVVMTVILVSYITLQAEVTATSQQIASKEQELTQLKAENDATYNDINDSISLEEVRRRAIQDLGMKYADRNQVVIYSGTEKDSVHQVSSLNDN